MGKLFLLFAAIILQIYTLYAQQFTQKILDTSAVDFKGQPWARIDVDPSMVVSGNNYYIAKVTTDEYRFSWTYYPNGNPITYKFETWFCGTSFENYLSLIYTYDNIGRLTESQMQYWIDSEWVNDELNAYAYDSSGNLQSHTIKRWGEEDWFSTYMRTYSYDSQNKILMYISKNFDDGVWVNFEKGVYTYDINGNLFINILQSWDNNAWKNAMRQIFTYDNRHNKLTGISQYWVNNDWRNQWMYIYSYDINNNMLTYTSRNWSGVTWINSTMFSYTYDNNRNMLTSIQQLEVNGVWINKFKKLYEYDNNGSLIKDLGQGWYTNEWRDISKKVYIFDDYNNALHGESTSYSGSSWNPSEGPFTIYNNGVKRVFHGTFFDAEYVMFVNAGKEYINNSFSLEQNYPNPFNPTTVIQYSVGATEYVSLKVYDILGNEIAILVNEEKPPGTYKIELNAAEYNLAAGIYFYSLRSGQFRETKKLLYLK